MSRDNATAPTDPLEDKDLLVEIVRALVDFPADVRVEEHRTDESTVCIIHCAENDRGKVVGKGGTTISAIRIILGRVAAVEGRKIYIQMASGPPAGGKPPQRQERAA
jgi:predicted RNA-binding protein YlqC (UPF0109 family)